MKYQTLNPATGQILQDYEYTTDQQLEQSLDLASKAFSKWKMSSVEVRRELLHKISSELKNNVDRLAILVTQEMGKPISDSRAEVLKSSTACDYYAENLEKFLQNIPVESNYSKSWVSPQPLGPLLGIMPWNYPYWQAFRFLAPALAAGNVILLKHSDLTSGTAVEIEKLISKCVQQVANEFEKFPIYQNIQMTHAQAAKVIADPRIRAVSFTGSARGGREVAMECAKVLKKSVLELGGSDAYIVCEDAPWSQAVESCVAARLVNNGQSCVAGKRFIVHESKVDQFISDFVTKMSTYKIGNPEQIETQLGPLAHAKFLKSTGQQIQEIQTRAKDQSLEIKSWSGSQSLPGVGTFIRPQLFYFKETDVLNPQLAEIFFKEEIFAPVAFVTSYKDIDQAFRLANQSIYGLGGGIFTSRTDEMALKIQNQLEAGIVTVNSQVKSDARLPFGGVKQSGYGRELGPYGFYEFINMKTVAMQ